MTMQKTSELDMCQHVSYSTVPGYKELRRTIIQESDKELWIELNVVKTIVSASSRIEISW
jgi:hypothetical protein